MARTGFKMAENNITLIGNELKIGDQAPAFTLTKNDLSPLTLNDLGDKVKIIAAVPSVDTKVCELETIRFNDEAGKLGDKAVVLTVSMDLPFAQARFCATQGIDNALTASDYKTKEFGEAYGVLIEELQLLNRSVFVLDQNNTIQYVQYVEQNTDHPDYDAALDAAKKLL